MNTSKTSLENLSAAVFMDQTSKVSSETYKESGYNRTNTITDYTKYNFLLKTNIGSYVPPAEFVDCWQQTSGPTLATYNSKLYAKVSGSTVWIGLTNASSNYMTGSISFNEENITRIFNYANATSTVKTGSVVAPVTWNSVRDVYITNKDAQKQDCTKTGSAYMYEDNSQLSKTFYIRHVVDPGWCLEPENYGKTDRAWYYKSLINPVRLVYDFKAAYSGTQYTNHKMINGVPLTELEKKKSDEIYNFLNVNFSVTKDSGFNATPYIIFFTSPTDIYKLSSVTGSNFLEISKSSNLTNKAKYMALTAGENNLFVDTSSLGSSNQVIYYKIIWESNMNKSLTITQPSLTLQTQK